MYRDVEWKEAGNVPLLTSEVTTLLTQCEGVMPKEYFTREDYLDVLNEALRHHPQWQPGMKFIFWPVGAKEQRALGVGFAGPKEKKAVFDQIEHVASRLCWTDEEDDEGKP